MRVLVRQIEASLAKGRRKVEMLCSVCAGSGQDRGSELCFIKPCWVGGVFPGGL